MSMRSLLAATILAAATLPAMAAQPAPTAAQAGKSVFRAQCALCHSAEPNDNGGAQGPSLAGVVGRAAGTAAGFSYTQALRNSGLTWDEATLNRFLAAPTTVVPGTAMVVPVGDATERANLVAYFSELGAGTFKEGAPQRGFGPPPGMMRAAPPVTTGTPDWKNDKPGRVHRIEADKLPEPYATPSAVNFPRVVERPANSAPVVPPGFTADVIASDLSGPRTMKIAPNGDILVAETNAGRIKVLRPSADGKSTTATVFAQGLINPFGIGFYPAGRNPQWVYVAETNRVVRYAYKTGDTTASGVPEIVVAQLSPAGGGHFTRDLVFSPDGRQMFVSVGSQANVPEELPAKTPEEIKAWEAVHGLGAAWGSEENRASVRVFALGRNGLPGPGRNFATGIRNCLTMTLQPGNGTLWCTTNERDMIGDDLVPDYSTRVRAGQFYGWPWYYIGDHEEPRLKDARPDLKGKVAMPDVLYQAHSAATGFAFYPQKPTGKAAFPKEYAGDAFAVLHGSWNRSQRTGQKVVQVPLKNGVPTGEYIDFMTGFIADDGNAWGRPVSAAVAPDGSLLVSDDAANLIYRVSYTGK